MINDNTLNFIRFSSGFNNLKKEELEAFAENEIFELNEYNASEEIQRKHFYTLLKNNAGPQGVAQEDGKYIHTAWAYNSDGTDGFTTVYPNLNLLDGTKDFSGDWMNSSSWVTNGTYKNLTVKTQNVPWTPISKKFTVLTPGIYTISEYIRNTGTSAPSTSASYFSVNGSVVGRIENGYNFDWKRVSFTRKLSAGDVIDLGTHAGTTGEISVAGYKVEQGSTATPYMQSASEVTTADWPSYMGQYTDYTLEDSINPSSYTWIKIQGKYFYTLEDVNTNGTLKSYIIECLKLSLQTRWGNNLEYHIDRKTKYLNKLTGMQA